MSGANMLVVEQDHFRKAAVEIGRSGENDTLPYDIDASFIRDKAEELSDVCFRLYQEIEAKTPQNAARFINGLTICSEFLMFVRTLIKVQQRNVSPQSLLIWKSSLEDIKSTFGPMKERFQAVGKGIARRMEQQGRKAKIKVLRFADSILLDETFLNSLCLGEWEQCLIRIEDSLVKAKIIDEASCGHYRKTVRFIYEHLAVLSSNESSAADE